MSKVLQEFYGGKGFPVLQELNVLKVLVGEHLILTNVVDQVGDEHEEPQEHSDQGQHISRSPHRLAQIPVLYQ